MFQFSNLLGLFQYLFHHHIVELFQSVQKKYGDDVQNQNQGVACTIRRTLGGDIDASCGQLRRKYQKQTP